MSVVFHVGAHKTGTSLIQKYFRDRVDDFDPRSVIAISRSDTNRLIGWGEMAIERPMRLRRRLEAELRKAPETLLVSHENAVGRPILSGEAGLYPHAAAAANGLAAAAEGLDASVVFYVRPVADFVESYYLQTIHEGAWHSFEEWFSEIDETALSWSPVIEALEQAFGPEKTIVGDFTEVKQGQNEFLALFMQRAGVRAPATVRYKPRRNASISSVGLQVARNINPFIETRAQRVATRKFLQEHFSNVEGDRARPMPADIRAQLDERYGDEYRRLADRSQLALV